MTTQHKIDMIKNLLEDEMFETNRMYFAYPNGYDQQVADRNNIVFKGSIKHICGGVGWVEIARILIDSGLAVTLSRAYCCARKEIARIPGFAVRPVDVKDAFVNLLWFVKLRETFQNMDPMLDENEDLADIVQNIQLDGNERRDLLRWG